MKGPASSSAPVDKYDPYFPRMLVGLIMAFATTTTLHAETEVWVSVTFILLPDGTRPANGLPTNIATASGFQAEVDWG